MACPTFSRFDRFARFATFARFASLLVATLVTTSSARADPPARGQTGLVLQLSGGLAVPTSPSRFTQGWQTGYGGNLFVGGFVVPHLVVGAGLGVASFDRVGTGSFGPEKTMERGGTATLVIPTFQVQLHASEGWFVPFVFAGAGLMRTYVADIERDGPGPRTIETDTKTAAAFELGVALRVPIGRVGDAMVSARFARGMDGTAYAPIGVGMHF